MQDLTPSKVVRVALGIVLVAVFLLGVTYISREIAFYDEGIYVANAKALASGVGYRNLSLPDAPPQAKYPPLFSFLLSLIWRLGPGFPDNLVIMRLFTVWLALGFLAVSYVYLRTALGTEGLESIAVVALIGLNAFFLFFATLLTSDILYALLSVAALYFYEQSMSSNRTQYLGLAIGLASAAFLTRTVGVLLIATLVVHLLLRRRVRWAAACFAIGGVVVVGWLAWSQWAAAFYTEYPVEVRGNYVGYLSLLGSPEWLGKLTIILAVNFRRLLSIWSFFVLPWGGAIVGILTLAVAGYAFLRTLGSEPRAHHLYCALYLSTVLVIPYPDTARYFLAISPFFIFYFLLGIRFLLSKGLSRPWSEAAGRRAAHVAIGIMVLVVLGHDVGLGIRGYQRTRAAPSPIYQQFHRMLDWIRENTPADAVLVGDYDPAYYLFTGRKAIRLSVNDNVGIYYAPPVARRFPRAGELLESFKRMNACHLIQDPMIGGPERLFFRDLVQALRTASPAPFSEIYAGEQGRFVVYKISGCRDEVVSAEEKGTLTPTLSLTRERGTFRNPRPRGTRQWGMFRNPLPRRGRGSG